MYRQPYILNSLCDFSIYLLGLQIINVKIFQGLVYMCNCLNDQRV